MRRVAWIDWNRAWPPSDAMRFLSAADNRVARARPPLLPSVLAISDGFTPAFYLTLSMNGQRAGTLSRLVSANRLTRIAYILMSILVSRIAGLRPHGSSGGRPEGS